MRTFDPTFLWRSTIGFDRLFDLIDSSPSVAGDGNYPPYNIERTGEDTYRVSLALAGFAPDEVSVTTEQNVVTTEQNVLTVEGRKVEKGDHQYLYQGISGRSFRRQFSLADYVQVKGAAFKDGVLQIDLVREVPEAIKPRRIAISSGDAIAERQQTKHKNAA
jgi:molecular chaperone IbpA